MRFLSSIALGLFAFTSMAQAGTLCEATQTTKAVRYELLCSHFFRCGGKSYRDYIKGVHKQIDISDEIFGDQMEAANIEPKQVEARAVYKMTLDETLKHALQYMPRAIHVYEHHATGYDRSIGQFQCKAKLIFNREYLDDYVFHAMWARLPDSDLGPRLDQAYRLGVVQWVIDLMPIVERAANQYIDNLQRQSPIEFSYTAQRAGGRLIVDVFLDLPE